MSYKIYLYDNDTDGIGSGSLSSSYVMYQLEAAAGRDVDVHISSAGGSCFDAIAIYDLLTKYNGNVTVFIDALASGPAAIAAMGGRKIVMHKYALLMIHARTISPYHNQDTLLQDVQMLNVVKSRLSQIFATKTGLDLITINSLTNAITWLSAEQALDLGFIDVISEYETTVTNFDLVKTHTSVAPAVYQRIINTILKKPVKKEKETSIFQRLISVFNP